MSVDRSLRSADPPGHGNRSGRTRGHARRDRLAAVGWQQHRPRRPGRNRRTGHAPAPARIPRRRGPSPAGIGRPAHPVAASFAASSSMRSRTAARPLSASTYPWLEQQAAPIGRCGRVEMPQHDPRNRPTAATTLTNPVSSRALAGTIRPPWRYPRSVPATRRYRFARADGRVPRESGLPVRRQGLIEAFELAQRPRELDQQVRVVGLQRQRHLPSLRRRPVILRAGQRRRKTDLSLNRTPGPSRSLAATPRPHRPSSCCRSSARPSCTWASDRAGSISTARRAASTAAPASPAAR